MRSIRSGLCLGLLMGSACLPARAADAVNGWSPAARITKIHSEGSRTLFKLSGVSDSCGHPDYWSVPLHDSAASKAKLAMLIAAYAAGKTVALRCENGQVTDFEVSDPA